MFRNFLYFIWFCIPTFFFLMALWSKLESISGKRKLESTSDFMRQGVFVLVCVFVAVGIDQYVLPGMAASLLPDLFPLEFWQILLLPFILFLAAKIVGPTREVRISQPPGGKSGRK